MKYFMFINTWRILQNVRDILASAAQVIARLTPILRGGTNYYDHVESRAAFDRMDAAVADLLRQWAKQRHPGWFQGKAVQQYFAPVKGPPPCFRDGRGQRIFRAHDAPHRTHVPIDPACHAYDPQWTKAMARRKARRDEEIETD